MHRKVVDKMGIGIVRDSFADRLFPGVSTIQTRVRHFTLTALLIQDHDRQPEHKKAKHTLEESLPEWEKWCRIEINLGRKRRTGAGLPRRWTWTKG